MKSKEKLTEIKINLQNNLHLITNTTARSRILFHISLIESYLTNPDEFQKNAYKDKDRAMLMKWINDRSKFYGN